MTLPCLESSVLTRGRGIEAVHSRRKIYAANLGGIEVDCPFLGDPFLQERGRGLLLQMRGRRVPADLLQSIRHSADLLHENLSFHARDRATPARKLEIMLGRKEVRCLWRLRLAKGVQMTIGAE